MYSVYYIIYMCVYTVHIYLNSKHNILCITTSVPICGYTYTNVCELIKQLTGVS